MKIKFLVNYAGRETAMKEYMAGDTDDISTVMALELIKLGVAEEVPEFVPDNVGPKSKRKGKEVESDENA